MKDFVNLRKRSVNCFFINFRNFSYGFDRDSPVVVNENAYNFTKCKFKLTKHGQILMNYINIPMSNPFLQKLGLVFCVSRGVNIGGNPSSRKLSFKFAKDFMKKTILK